MTTNREQLAKQVLLLLPKDIKIAKIAYFPKKLLITGQCHISRKELIRNAVSRAEKQFGWQLVPKIIYLEGNSNEEITGELISSFSQRLDIEKISLDLAKRNATVQLFNLE